MTVRLTRRAALIGLLSSSASIALAGAPTQSPRPTERPPHWPPPPRPVPRPDIHDFIAEARLGGTTGFVIADTKTGEIIESGSAHVPLPPASVTKALTSVYGLEALGPHYQFRTTLRADGTITDGVLDGTLILVGGGDPTLVTDDLALMAEQLAATGLREVRGGFEVWNGALPYINEIDPDQLDHLGYNPAVSGLNLNFNRVYFEWARTAGDYRVSLDARSELYRPEVHMARMRIVDRDLPIYTYDADGEVDDWTVARRALGNDGSRWLPVRQPALYAGDVFRSFASSHGITLPAPTKRNHAPRGATLMTHSSEPLTTVVRDCLKYSTNLTAEAIGLTASARLAGEVEDQHRSADHMCDWIAQRTGARIAVEDHSGLGSDSKVSAAQMVKFLMAEGVEAQLRPLLKSIPIKDEDGRPMETPIKIAAKTGTLNFVSSLAGYIRTETGRELAFAIFSANLGERMAAEGSLDDVPAGAVGWNHRAKALQQVLLKRWGRY
jgi:D-alanyl-D-alanine carboxypeptidase/D-alanyl-D-alanine-endopeptidase (penicillin-binding protein 4)